MSRFKRPDPVSESDSEQEESDSEPEEGWGAAYHVSRKEREQGSPVADTRAEQLELEQEELYEARRIQRLAREKLVREDFGDFDAVATEQRSFIEEEEEAAKSNGITEIHFDKPVPTAQTEIEKPQMTREEAIVHLVATQPHLLSLLHDFADCAANLPEAEQRHKTLVAVHNKAQEPLHPAIGLSKLHLDLSKAYLSVSAFWLKLVAEGGSAELAETVLKRLVGLREGLQSLEEQGIGMEEDEEDEDGPISMLELLNDKNMDREELLEFLQSQEDDEDEEELELDEEDASTEDMSAFGEEEDEQELSEAEIEPEPVSKKRKATSAPVIEKKKRKTEKEESSRPSFLQPDYESAAKPKKSNKATLATDDFIEAPSLTSHEANDRAAKKHTLRFHTSQINQKANRRSAARGALAGGDEDVPQRSKEALRREAQRRESAKRAKELEADAASAKKVAESAGPDEGEDGYYGLIKKGKKVEKDLQKEEYDHGRLEDRYVSESSLEYDLMKLYSATLQTLQSADGPRSVSRAILANKGLTPKRAKANRNPRVKKRLKYEKAKKKVSSMKSIYKADTASAGRSGYSGEKSGIANKVVKSRKL